MGKKYKIGFARPALLHETVQVVQCFCELRDWTLVKQEVKDTNLLQCRTERSSDIMYSEITKRLSLLSSAQIELLSEDESQNVRHLIWIALCKQYPFIGDFTIEVLADAHATHRFEISHDDYGYFFNAKADWHPELESVSDKTRSNARQALFQMMRQCELISDANQLIPQMLSSALQNCSPESDLAFIPGAIRL
ncbi:DUF1819 family protein [Shewanella sp. SG41-4]|uniref:DUF1819 family protein n=1 Tax=Shewanella sp. SG41-4 TaxID=2760976 RepID=UPI0016041F65|nr:DUF1819 family protein [Shewanella sp. SG41-4]